MKYFAQIKNDSVLCDELIFYKKFLWHIAGRLVVLPNKAQDTTIEEHPYQVSLGLVNSHYCSGTILSPDVILTTGHCADGFAEMSNYSIVRAGSTIKNRGGVIRGIKGVIIHEKYDYNFTLDHNVALILVNNLKRNFQQL